MAKNRRHQSASIRFGPALKAFLLCALIGGSGVGYVWQKSQIDLLGQQIVEREKRLLALKDQNKKLGDQMALLSSPRMLEARVHELQLGMGPPGSAQVIRLTEPPLRGPSNEPPSLSPQRTVTWQHAARYRQNGFTAAARDAVGRGTDRRGRWADE